MTLCRQHWSEILIDFSGSIGPNGLIFGEEREHWNSHVMGLHCKSVRNDKKKDMVLVIVSKYNAQMSH